MKLLARSKPAMEVLLKELTAKLLQREFYFTVASQVCGLGSKVVCSAVGSKVVCSAVGSKVVCSAVGSQ